MPTEIFQPQCFSTSATRQRRVGRSSRPRVATNKYLLWPNTIDYLVKMLRRILVASSICIGVLLRSAPEQSKSSRNLIASRAPFSASTSINLFANTYGTSKFAALIDILIKTREPAKDAHPLCWYGPDRAVSFTAEATFCPDDQPEGFCCVPDEEAVLQETYATAGVSAGCAELYKEVLCGVCNPYSAHLYSRLGTDDGLAMTEEFCDSFYTACAADLGLPSTYCETHVQDGPTAEYWSYPLDIAADATDEGLVVAFPNLPETSLPENPLSLQLSPDGTKWWIGGMEGVIKEVAAGDPTGSVDVLDITSKVAFAYEQGLLGFAFGPSFTSTGIFYVSYTSPGEANDINVLSKFVYAEGDPGATAASEEVLIETSEKASSAHSAGWVGFAPSSYTAPDDASHDLYWSIGDSGPQDDPLDRAQDPMEYHGSIIRITVSSDLDGTGYLIPAGNLFDGTDGLAEICAMGFRNPYKCGFDKETDQLYCGDVGQNSVEEVNVVECGKNYGWRLFEGSRCHDGFDGADCASQGRAGFVFPTYQYCHFDYDSAADTVTFTGGVDICGDRTITGLSVIGGYVYRGSKYADLMAGYYLFADWSTGTLHYLAPASGGGWEAGTLGSVPKLVGFAEDQDGEIYMIGYQGNIYELPCGDLCSTTADEACMSQARTIPTFEEMGCFGDDRTAPALSLAESKSCGTMNAEMCASFCATIEGAVYFGLEYQRECFCGGVSDDYAVYGASDSCNMPCSGYPSETCGGDTTLSVFMITSFGEDEATGTPAPAAITAPEIPLPTAENYMGCYVDSKDGRVLGMASTQTDTMTEGECETFCSDLGATIYGVEYGTQCFCGDDTSDFEFYGASATGCDFVCAGDATVTCGGDDAIAVYTIIPGSASTTQTIMAGAGEPDGTGYYGCFTDIRRGRILGMDKTSSENMTPASCLAFCKPQGATLYGVEWSTECWCGDIDTFEAVEVAEDQCDLPCSGAPGTMCGGYLNANVYAV